MRHHLIDPQKLRQRNCLEKIRLGDYFLKMVDKVENVQSEEI